jgi:uncharacterized integral membrane protein
MSSAMADPPPSDTPPQKPPQKPPPDGTAVPGPESAVQFTRAAALWTAMIAGFVILILLLVFILQNTESTTIQFLGASVNLPVGVAVLLSAVCGGLVTVGAGTARIVQLRRAAKKNLKAR